MSEDPKRDDSTKDAGDLCVDCRVASAWSEGLCRPCWIFAVQEAGGNPIAAFIDWDNVPKELGGS